MPVSERPASRMDTLAQGPSCGGVTSVQALPPSRVTWTRPSSLPAQMIFASTGDGASAYTTPRCVALAGSVPRYLPTFAGGSHVLRVRSGLISFQLSPRSVDIHTL